MPNYQLDQILEQVNAKKLPPVEKWNPPLTGELDMHITVDGSWYYQGSLIKRKSMVKLFSTILKKERSDYYMVTPIEKYRIVVEDAPFVAIEVDQIKTPTTALLFRTNVDDQVIADAKHRISVEVDKDTLEPRPYLHIRNNLSALISRNVFYQLVEWAVEVETKDSSWLEIESQGQTFKLGTL